MKGKKQGKQTKKIEKPNSEKQADIDIEEKKVEEQAKNSDKHDNVEEIENVEVEQIIEKIEEQAEKEEIEELEKQVEMEEQEKKEQDKETSPKAESKEDIEILSEIKETESNSSTEFRQVIQKDRRKIIGISIIIIGVLIFLAVFSVIFALANVGNTKIMQGVSVKGIDISNLTKEEAKIKIEESFDISLEQTIELKHNEYEASLTPSQIEAHYDVDSLIDEAYSIGRNGNILTNNYAIFFLLISKKDISSELIYNEEALKSIIDDMSKKIPGAVEEATYSIEDNNLVITKGKAGLAIKEKKLNNLIIDAIENPSKDYVEVPTEYKEPKDANIDEIHSEVCTEPKDAYYETNPFKIYPHVVGVDFNISLEEARQLLKEDKEEYIIELKYTMPEKTTNMIGTEAFPDLISTFSTKYDVSNKNRSQNLILAADKINGTVLMPGEVFSYNRIVGKRTVEAGYKEAAMYSGGKVVDGLGGGICQISSTLYNTALYANLEIVQRSNHQFVTSYVGAGRDATVVYGAIDFQFKNTRQYPIKIVCTVKDGIADIKMYGIKEETEYVVEIETKITGSIPYTTKYEENSSLDIGVEQIIQKGSPGYTSTTYKILKLNGVEVSRGILSNDTYSAMQRIISKGTRGQKVVETSPTQPETPVNLETPEYNNEAE